MTIATETRLDRLEYLMREVWRGFDRAEEQLEQEREFSSERWARIEHQANLADARFERERKLSNELADARFERERKLSNERWARIERQNELADKRWARIERQAERTDRELERLSREMSDFKDEMSDFKDEMRQTTRGMNKRWGELANKMGTLAEDIVAPSIPRILRQVIGCAEEEIEMSAVRLRRRHPKDKSKTREFDVVAVCQGYVLANETKSSLHVQHVDDFTGFLPDIREYFPEYPDYRFFGALASLYVDASVVKYGEKKGILILGLGEDLMDTLNQPGFTPRWF
ncbi:MAG: hypothetical protein ACE5GO_02825 [Anaerolineales bacterium]